MSSNILKQVTLALILAFPLVGQANQDELTLEGLLQAV